MPVGIDYLLLCGCFGVVTSLPRVLQNIVKNCGFLVVVGAQSRLLRCLLYCDNRNVGKSHWNVTEDEALHRTSGVMTFFIHVTVEEWSDHNVLAVSALTMAYLYELAHEDSLWDSAFSGQFLSMCRRERERESPFLMLRNVAAIRIVASSQYVQVCSRPSEVPSPSAGVFCCPYVLNELPVDLCRRQRRPVQSRVARRQIVEGGLWSYL